MDENTTTVIVALSVFGSLGCLAISIRAIARAWVERGRDENKLLSETATPLADVRLARLERAVDTIALEVERMSEAQRFASKALSEQPGTAPRGAQQLPSPDTTA